jgi:diacylglycerol kinase family enzyme
VRAALSAFRAYQCEEYEVRVGGDSARHRAFLIEVANTAHWGNYFRIAPTASVFDGALEVVIVDPISVLDAPLFGARLRFGSVHRSRRVSMQRVSEIVIRGASQMHLDGEPWDAPVELRIRVRPRSLHVLVPPDARVV